MLLYGTGLRIGEALSLDLADVDLESALLRIRETKFYKTRIVPVGADLTRVLRDYLLERSKRAPITRRWAIPADAPRQATIARRRRRGVQATAPSSQGVAYRRLPLPASAA